MSDLIIQALAGLDAEYNPIVVQLSNQAGNMTWIELQSALYTFETRIDQLNQFSHLFVNNNNANYAKYEHTSNFHGN